MVGFVNGFWTIFRHMFMKSPQPKEVPMTNYENDHPAPMDHDMEHRALMFLMNQKTDAMLAALANTIDQERQKLGLVVRKPSMTETLEAFETDLQTSTMDVSKAHRSPHGQILSMVQNGKSVPTIARQLEMPEETVSLVMRFNAA